jgi:hypothetical protein
VKGGEICGLAVWHTVIGLGVPGGLRSADCAVVQPASCAQFTPDVPDGIMPIPPEAITL